MTQQDDRSVSMRNIVANAYNAHTDDRKAFREQVRSDGTKQFGSIIVVIALIGLAIKCYLLWRSLNLTSAPTMPVAGEPDFSLIDIG